MTNDLRWRTAVHESSHIIVARQLSMPVEGVRIGRHGHSVAAIASVEQIYDRWLRDGDYRGGDMRAATSAKLMICLAGDLGELIHTDVKPDDNNGDARMIATLRRQFNISDARMQRLERRTKRLLLDHFEEVIYIAAWLKQYDHLSGENIDLLLKAAECA
jgi:hypothetical protein